MQSAIAPSQWWVQLLDSSPLENHDALRFACRQLATTAEYFRHVWARSNPTPTAIVAQGYGTPPDIYKFLRGIQHLLERNEYMIFAMMVEADSLDRDAISHAFVTRTTLAQAATGKELLDKVKAIILDTDEELAAGS